MKNKGNFKNELIVWGSNRFGQLGFPTKENENEKEKIINPCFVSFSIEISQVSCGDFHTILVTNSGFLYAMGNNRNGELGVGEEILQSESPLLIETLTRFRAVQAICGSTHSLVVLESGESFGWGSNKNYALGLEFKKIYFVPNQILIFEEKEPAFIIKAFSNENSSVVLTNKFEAWVSKEKGYVKIKIEERVISAAIGNNIVFLLNENGEVVIYNLEESFMDKLVLNGNSIGKIKANKEFFVAIDEFGEVFGNVVCGNTLRPFEIKEKFKDIEISGKSIIGIKYGNEEDLVYKFSLENYK